MVQIYQHLTINIWMSTVDCQEMNIHSGSSRSAMSTVPSTSMLRKKILSKFSFHFPIVPEVKISSEVTQLLKKLWFLSTLIVNYEFCKFLSIFFTTFNLQKQSNVFCARRFVRIARSCIFNELETQNRKRWWSPILQGLWRSRSASEASWIPGLLHRL